MFTQLAIAIELEAAFQLETVLEPWRTLWIDHTRATWLRDCR